MTVGELIVYLVLGLICGLFGQMLAGRSLGGYVVSTIVGLAGAVFGSMIARAIGAPEPLPVSVGGKSIPILWAIIGAALVTLVVSYLRSGSVRRAR